MKSRDVPPDHDPVRRLVTAIPCCQESLGALAVHKRGSVLLAHCPALAVLVALSGKKLPVEARALHWKKLAALPWCEILAHVGLPARPKVLRIISKLSWTSIFCGGLIVRGMAFFRPPKGTLFGQ